MGKFGEWVEKRHPGELSEGWGTTALNALQGGLDVAGLVPGVNTVANLANAGIDVARGNYGNAMMNAVGAIPFAGAAAKGAGLAAKYAPKLAGLASKAAPMLGKVAQYAAPVAGMAGDAIGGMMQGGQQPQYGQQQASQWGGYPQQSGGFGNMAQMIPQITQSLSQNPQMIPQIMQMLGR